MTALASATPVKAATLGYETNFSVPPYSLEPGNSVHGIDGWQRIGGLAEDITVIAAPWNLSDTALSLTRTAAQTTNPTVNLRNNTATPLTGIVRIKLSAAFNHNGTSQTATTFAFENMANVAARLGFGLDYEKGLYYRYKPSTSEDVVVTNILSLSEVKKFSLYDFSLIVDTDADTFSFSVTGEKADGSDFDFQVNNLAFTGFDQISNFYLWHSATTFPAQQRAAYINSLSVQPIPEPGTSALLALSLAGAGFFLSRKKGQKRG